ncbi:MAG: hypothetical protein SCH71_08580 [Desulfobulbaceae bacterium]|nr:hypothetical protein [Desulfobulbaceae bacterium]
MDSENEAGGDTILFGLNRAEDERSLASFLKLFGREQLTAVLIPRMTAGEIEQIVDLLSAIMRNHLSEKEYHSLFLGDENHGH